MIKEISKKTAENKCYSVSIRSQLESEFLKETTMIISFVKENSKFLRKRKLEKFHSLFFAKIVLSNATIFPTLSNDASTLILTKLSQNIVCDFKRWSKKDAVADSIPEQSFGKNEIYGLQYIGGYVIHKLYNRIVAKKGSEELKGILISCKGDAMEADSKMIAALNRGGLWYISKHLQKILEIVELNFRRFVYVHKRLIDIDKFVAENVRESEILDLYDEMILLSDSYCSSTNRKIALQSILELYAKVRVYSYARKKTQEAKMKSNSKQKGIRTELKRNAEAAKVLSELPE